MQIFIDDIYDTMSRRDISIRRSYGCCCGEFVSEPNEPCASNANAKTACIVPSRCCCRCLRVCKKLAKCETPPCMTDVQSCSGSRCCGCRCEKPGQICISPPKICSSPAHSSRGRSPCAPRCLPQSLCLSRSCCSGAFECARCKIQLLKSPHRMSHDVLLLDF